MTAIAWGGGGRVNRNDLFRAPCSVDVRTNKIMAISNLQVSREENWSKLRLLFKFIQQLPKALPVGHQPDISNKSHQVHRNVLFSERSGIREIAKRLGLGEDLKVQLNRYVFTISSFTSISSMF